MIGRRLGVGIVSLLVSMAACSDDNVEFPPGDAGSDTVADTNPGMDVAVDRGTEAGPMDVRPDISSDPTIDMGIDTEADRAEVRVDTTPDMTSTDGTIDAVSDATDVNSNDAVTDAGNDVNGDDGSSDAVSEDAQTCAQRCASGVCDTNGDCTPCVKDDECTGGKVCNAGTCGPRCGDGGVTCTGTLVCCNEHCVDTTRDDDHCGMCGVTCSATQFCGNASTPACKDNIVRNICNTKKATFLLDGLTDDDASSNVVKGAITTLCMPAPVSTSVLQTTSTAINTTTGQPLAGGGELLVAAGGDSWHRLVKYLESSGTSTVYNESDGTTQLTFKRRRGAADGGDAIIQTVPLSSVTPGHDFFTIYVIKDPISGTLSLVVYGIESAGTKAGAFYFANVMLPNIVGADVTTFTQAWYVYEWTAADAGAGPSVNDTFMPIAAGQ